MKRSEEPVVYSSHLIYSYFLSSVFPLSLSSFSFFFFFSLRPFSGVWCWQKRNKYLTGKPRGKAALWSKPMLLYRLFSLEGFCLLFLPEGKFPGSSVDSVSDPKLWAPSSIPGTPNSNLFLFTPLRIIEWFDNRAEYLLVVAFDDLVLICWDKNVECYWDSGGN